jgi:hypothetical protein
VRVLRATPPNFSTYSGRSRSAILAILRYWATHSFSASYVFFSACEVPYGDKWYSLSAFYVSFDGSSWLFCDRFEARAGYRLCDRMMVLCIPR